MALSIGIENLDYNAIQAQDLTTNLESKVAEIREARVNWQSYLQGQMISQRQFDFISHLDNAANADVRSRVINEFNDEVPQLFVSLLNRISKEQTLQYLLSLMDEMFTEETSRVELFRKYFDSKSENIWNYFFNFLQRSDQICVYQISKIITKLACWSSQKMDEKSLSFFYDWLLEHIQESNNEFIRTIARNLQMLLRVRNYRGTFVEKQGVPVLLKVLADKSSNMEIHYQLTFCLWCLSFNKDLVPFMVKEPTLVNTVCDIFTNTDREKDLRICMALMRSILGQLSDARTKRAISLRMVQHKALKRLELLNQKELNHDPEMSEDLKVLRDDLLACVHDVSSLEEYVTELTSGRLEWSPVHKSDQFWRENADKFTENNYELLRMLIYLLEYSTDPEILSIASHDVGEFVSHYPRGKQVVDKLNAKPLVMTLLQHNDASVRYNALLALQKIMVHNWNVFDKYFKHSAFDWGRYQYCMKYKEYLGRQLETQKPNGGASNSQAFTSTTKNK
ncbi:unnamed protein product [Hymenolepis diminuta]|uniref:V-type proton ATPase subunit H n=1 Tax=Hymenolepis diminuta TaxID=6216 RepID=A0A564Z2A6_HYMDI|nr:unnamed protein product [Hymenolepis diminuta]